MNSTRIKFKTCYNMLCGKTIYAGQRKNIYCSRDCAIEVRQHRTVHRLFAGKIYENKTCYPHKWLPVQLIIEDDWADKLNKVINTLTIA